MASQYAALRAQGATLVAFKKPGSTRDFRFSDFGFFPDPAEFSGEISRKAVIVACTVDFFILSVEYSRSREF